MDYIAIAIILLELMLEASGLFSSVDCPPELRREIATLGDSQSLHLDCTMQLLCKNPYQDDSPCPLGYFYDDSASYDCIPENETTCEVKFKVTVVQNFNIDQDEVGPCALSQDPGYPALLSHPDNCSMFYKCDWGSAILFECPEELHFNSELQVCDWPWQARCDSSWTRCPRPQPRCPAHHTRPIYLPHPYLCDHFYQCNWGNPLLQTCPAGLHFNPRLNVCDWPYNSKCKVC
ncbi:peritrophin-1 [Cephus cinctus]|uniref:Peritrophin-1 n=1 Tax=Cephus cinctus TaxID=211228 RepID=A0AAJ7FG72_CEPCN|nr:peritrophin-1 [Cephus cinctus]